MTPLRVFLTLVLATSTVLAQGSIPLTPEEYKRQAFWRAGNVQVTRPRVDFRAYMPPVGNQGAQASCAAWAAGYAAGGFHQGIRRGRQPRRSGDLMSPAFLYNLAKEPKGGTVMPKLFAVWRKRGVANWESMPYTDRDDKRKPNATQYENAKEFGIMGYGKVESVGAMRAALSMMYPVVIGMRTTKRFLQGRFETYRLADHRASAPEKGVHMGHAVCIIGYDDRHRAFLVQNSWGTKWGRGGYCWLGYDLFQKVGPQQIVYEAWVIERQRGVHPRAADALADPSFHYRGIYPRVLAWDDEGTFRWKIEVEADYFIRQRSLRAIEWRWTGLDGKRRTAVSKVRGEFLAPVESVERRPGVVTVWGKVHFTNGSSVVIRQRVLLFRGQ